jgi:hypothetical protein
MSLSPPEAADQVLASHPYASAHALLHDLRTRVQHGAHWYTGTVVTAHQLPGVLTRWALEYDTLIAPDVADYRRRKGQPVVRALWWPLRNDPAGYTTRFGLLLLSTEHLAEQRTLDARVRAIRVELYAQGGLVLQLRGTRSERPRGPGRTRRSAYDWRWCADAASEERMCTAWREAADAEAGALLGVARRYRGVPMVAGYRAQLVAARRAAWPVWGHNSRPSALALKAQIQRREVPCPLRSRLPSITAFPQLRDPAGPTLREYLSSNERVQAERLRQARQLVRDEHAGAGL